MRPLVALAAALLLTAVPAAASAQAPAFAPGALSGGDRLFPWVGNGGYDATHYAIALRHRPQTRRLRATATMTATATQDLSSFGLDLQGYRVRWVRVDGAPARFERRRPRGWRERSKLVVTPAAGIPSGTPFRVTVRYAGRIRPVVDPDGSWEGAIPTDTGMVVLGEPIGAMGWFPANNTPADKATFAVTVTVPRGLWGISNGALLSRRTRGGWTTHRWREDSPMAPYLATATVGRYDVRRDRSPRGVPLFNAIDLAANTNRRPWAGHEEVGAPLPAITRDGLRRVRGLLRRQGATLDFLASAYGAYPFASAGAIVANAGYIGYALEVQTKPVYVERGVHALTHELAHQWWGNSVGFATWSDIWLAEGFAVWSEWRYEQDVGGSRLTTADRWDRLWKLPERERTPDGLRLRDIWKPVIPRRSEDVFGDAVYRRGAMTVEGLRQIVGDDAFWRILRTWQAERRHATGTTADFVALAERESGMELDAYFDEWLRRSGKPRIAPRSLPNARRSASRSAITRGHMRLAR
ncbi:MAG TPA: M1 family metallopeptidase [Capillimicrobium sp.]|nr:M1 family metallopeptidase [Capillimicrobium sp.]